MSAWVVSRPNLIQDTDDISPHGLVHKFLSCHPGVTPSKPSEEIQKFLTKNCRDLLTLALSPSSGELGQRAFLLLSTAPRRTAIAVLNDDFLFLKATEALSQPSPNPIIVSRLSCILARVLTKNRACVIEAVAFLTQLLRFIDDPSVLSLYSSILDVNSKVRDIQPILAASNFSSFVTAELNQFPQGEKAANLCTLVRLCCKHPVLRPSFTTETVMNLLTGLIDSDDPFVLNQAWLALGAFCGDVTSGKMTKVYDRAISLLRDTPATRMYHVYACDFIGKMLFYAPGMFDKAKRQELADLCKNLIVRYENATNLIGAVFRILRIAAKSHPFLLLVVSDIVPLLVEYAKSPQRTARAANAMQYLADLEESKNNNKTVAAALDSDKEYCQFRTERLRMYMILRKQDYGGTLAKYVQKSRSYDSCLRYEARGVKVLCNK